MNNPDLVNIPGFVIIYSIIYIIIRKDCVSAICFLNICKFGIKKNLLLKMKNSLKQRVLIT
jgi:hypothetical protein